MNDIMEKIEKKIRGIEIGLATNRERVFMLEKELDKIKAKKEINYAELVKVLLQHIFDLKEEKDANYLEIIKKLMER